jgi:hypothetical protein
MKDLVKLLEDVFKIYGYEVRRDEVFDFVAKRDEKELGVYVMEKIGERDVRRFQKLDSTCLLITPSRIPEKIKEDLKDQNIEVWDRETLEREVGRAILFEILGDEKVGEIRSKKTGEYVKLCISSEDAMWICRSFFGKCDAAILRYIPFWIYEYEVRGFKEYEGKEIRIVGRGEGAINAVTGENHWISVKNMERVNEPEGEVLLPELDMEDALKEAKKKIKERHVVKRSFNRIVRESLISEMKRFYPEDHEISLKMEMIYLPIWEVRYKDKRIEINGYDGKPLEEVPTADVEFI